MLALDINVKYKKNYLILVCHNDNRYLLKVFLRCEFSHTCRKIINFILRK